MELPLNTIQNCRGAVKSSAITSIQTGREVTFYLYLANAPEWCTPQSGKAPRSGQNPAC